MPSPVRVYLCRHAHAAPGSPDVLRVLSDEGRRRAAAMGAGLAATSPRPTLVLTSPVRRAQQTADAIAGSLGLETCVEPALAPGATVATLRVAVRARPGHAAVAAVAHQPDCSRMALSLTGRDPGFAPGDVHAVDLDA